MKKKINIYITLLLFAVGLMFPSSCSKSYLDVVDPGVLDASIYPAKVEDFEMMMNSLYGRLRVGIYGQFVRHLVLMDHSFDNGYNGAQFNEFALNNIPETLGPVSTWWTNFYTHITKCNDFLLKLDKFKKSGALITTAEEKRLKTMEAEARFLRSFNYFNLINLWGESPIFSAADMSKMGVPLWVDEVAGSITATSRARATQQEVWNQIIADFEAAVPLLAGQGKINGQLPRIDEWTVKSYLAKAYMFTLQWNKAVPVLKDIIDNSGKKLVSYDIYKNMFGSIGGKTNNFNSESIWEVNYTYDPQDNGQTTGTGSVWARYGSVTFIKNKIEVINGFSNFYVHDENVPRFGFDDRAFNLHTDNLFPGTTPNDLSTGKVNPEYKAWALKVRAEKLCDPRLYVNTMQPFIDSVNINDGSGLWYLVIKGRFEGYNNKEFRAYNGRKYTLLDEVYNGNTGINMYVLRLPEIYLLYAEALIKSGGDQALALEYINKVHRRAYSQPVDTPSSYDYKSLTDRTVTVRDDDHLANDPLKYEVWAETFNEGGFWFNIRRWNIGEQEVKYFKKSNSGVLVWQGQKAYTWPIPLSEIEANPLMKRNPI